jgi:hypothetical protein
LDFGYLGDDLFPLLLGMRGRVLNGVLPARLRKFTVRTVDLGRFRPVSGVFGASGGGYGA